MIRSDSRKLTIVRNTLPIFRSFTPFFSRFQRGESQVSHTRKNGPALGRPLPAQLRRPGTTLPRLAALYFGQPVGSHHHGETHPIPFPQCPSRRRPHFRRRP